MLYALLCVGAMLILKKKKKPSNCCSPTNTHCSNKYKDITS